MRREVHMNDRERNEKLEMIIENPRLGDADRKAEFDRLLGPTDESMRKFEQTVFPYRKDGYVGFLDTSDGVLYLYGRNVDGTADAETGDLVEDGYVRATQFSGTIVFGSGFACDALYHRYPEIRRLFNNNHGVMFVTSGPVRVYHD